MAKSFSSYVSFLSFVGISFACLISALGLISCSQKPRYSNSQFVDLGSEGMVPYREYIFSPFDSLSDLESSYNISIALRFSDICKIKSLPINIETSSLEWDSIRYSKLDILLFNDKDNNEGKGNFNVYETEVPFISDIKKTDGLTISISTPEKDTEGIISLGVVSVKNL